MVLESILVCNCYTYREPSSTLSACLICVHQMAHGLTYFLRLQGSECRNPFLGQIEAKMITAAHRHL